MSKKHMSRKKKKNGYELFILLIINEERRLKVRILNYACNKYRDTRFFFSS